MQSKNATAAAVAQGQYEFITQTEYKTPEAAEDWIKQNLVEEVSAVK